MTRFLRDPLLHFALLGAALFGAFTLLARDDARDDLIVVTATQQQQLIAAYERTWRTPPGEAERDALIRDWVREEIANREARGMGLADGDLIVRRRLRQKFEAFMEQLAMQHTASDTDLESWYASHQERYREDARFSFTQRFFSSDSRADAEADAVEALATLAGASADTPINVGDALALPRQFRDTRRTEVESRFGAPFARALTDLPVGRWAGPVPSAYGYHLVFVAAATDARLPALGEVREAVLRDWRDAQLREAREQLYVELRQRYRVHVEPVPAA